MPTHCRRDEYGFTLTEMLIVILIGGVLSAIAIPSFRTWAPKYRANGAARELFSELMAAKAKAISEGNNYIVSFDTGNNAYTIHDDDNSNGVQDAGEVVRTVDIPASYPGIEYGYIDADNPSGEAITGVVTFTGSPPRAMFYPSGLSKAGSVYLMADDNRPDRQRCVTVNLTGRVRLYKHTGSAWE